MQSKNKPAPTKAEELHILRLKRMACICCGVRGKTEVHELEQGLWFTGLPVCDDCHRGSHNGLHGRMHIWKVKKLTPLLALNMVIAQLMRGVPADLECLEA